METPESGLHRIMAEREEKAQKLREQGLNPYANDFAPSKNCSEFRQIFEAKTRNELAGDESSHRLAGRVMAVRSMGKASFLRIKDQSGDLQLFLQQNRMGASYDMLKLLDVGDIVGVLGSPMRTKTEELSLAVSDFRILTKSLRPLPEKWHGLTNV